MNMTRSELLFNNRKNGRFHFLMNKFEIFLKLILEDLCEHHNIGVEFHVHINSIY